MKPGDLLNPMRLAEHLGVYYIPVVFAFFASLFWIGVSLAG